MTDFMPGNISCFQHNMEEVDLELLMLLFVRNASISLPKILSPFTDAGDCYFPSRQLDNNSRLAICKRALSKVCVNIMIEGN